MPKPTPRRTVLGRGLREIMARPAGTRALEKLVSASPALHRARSIPLSLLDLRTRPVVLQIPKTLPRPPRRPVSRNAQGRRTEPFDPLVHLDERKAQLGTRGKIPAMTNRKIRAAEGLGDVPFFEVPVGQIGPHGEFRVGRHSFVFENGNVFLVRGQSKTHWPVFFKTLKGLSKNHGAKRKTPSKWSGEVSTLGFADRRQSRD